MKWCNEPFAFFGHSLGARIAFELASVLENEFSIVAKYLFISGCLSPERFTQAMKVREKDLSDLTLIEVLTDLGGTPPELLDKYSLMKEALPVIRADFQLAIDISKSTPLPINVPISLFLGSEDRVTNLVYDYSGWANQTAKSCQLSVVNGNHFFIRSNMMAIVRVINKKVKELLINGN
ncbi:hypothetical protein BIY28_23045 [Brenneria goodwinii]|nr:hypothetical protein BIY28_23045 [Brenneria goodwinii]